MGYIGYKNFRCGNCNVVQRLPFKCIYEIIVDNFDNIHYYFDCPDCNARNEVDKKDTGVQTTTYVATLVDKMNK